MLGADQELLAEARQRRFSAAFFKQRKPKLLFKLRYRMAQTRLRNAQLLGSLRILLYPCQRDKVSQIK